MPRTLDPTLAMALDRANPNVCHFVEVNTPDSGLTLRRADQWLATPPLVSQSPASSLNIDSAGALTLASTPATLASFTHPDDGTVTLPRPDLSKHLRGLAWRVDPTFGKTVLRSFSALIKRKNTGSTNDLQLQIYGTTINAYPNPGGFIPASQNLYVTFIPLLANPIIWKNPWATGGSWASNLEIAVFDLSPLHFQMGSVHSRNEGYTVTYEDSFYYFVIDPVNPSADDLFTWYRDRTASHNVANVGAFEDRFWNKAYSDGAFPLQFLDTSITPAVPYSTLTIENYVASSQAVYAITLPTVPIAASVGRIVFEPSAPTGTAASVEISTAGTGGPWTVVRHDDPVTVKQLTYHLRVTLGSDTSHRVAPRVAALGIEFKVPVDVTAEAIVEPITQEIAVPFLGGSVGEGRVSILRTGRRDYRDPGSELASQSPSSKLEAVVWLGSRHPAVTRDKWLLVDRAFVSNREPTATAEQFGLLSYRKVLKRKIPGRIETINELRTVASATTTSVTVTTDLPDASPTSYLNRGFYMRVRSSTAAGVGAGYQKSIQDSTGTPPRTITFNTLAPMPGTLVAGDIIEVHSGFFVQDTLTYQDADPADVWLDLLENVLETPAGRIGRGDLGAVSRSGLPPKVTDRAPGDTTTQNKLKVTIAIHEAEEAAGLIDQLSFIMGGCTVDIGGQIVFRQIYPLRDTTGQIVVPAEPVAAVFDARNSAAVSTPVALEQRITQLACNYGVDLTSVSKDTPPALTTNFVDIDALAWLDDQAVDDLSPAAIPDDIARWCYNSEDAGEYLASQLTLQVIRAASTGLRVWTWAATEAQPNLVVGDRVTVITDQYTDYDPARKMSIRGWWAFTLAVVSVQGGGRQFRGFMLGLADAVQLKGGPGTLAPPDKTGPVTMRVVQTAATDVHIVVDVYVSDQNPDGGPITIVADGQGVGTIAPASATITPPADVVTGDLLTTAHKTFTIDRPVIGSQQGRVTFRAENDKGVGATASIDVMPELELPSLALRVHRSHADDSTVTLDAYVADLDPDPDELITVAAFGEGVAAVVADDGSQSALMTYQGNLVRQAFNVTMAPWSNRSFSAVTFDPTVAGPDGVLGVSKLVSTGAGQYTGQQILAGEYNGVVFEVVVWMRCASATMSVTFGLLKQGDAGSGVTTTVAVTTAWQRFTFTGPVTSSTANLSYYILAAGAGTLYPWGMLGVIGSVGAVTDDLDTTDFVRFTVTRPDANETATNVCLQSEDFGSAPWTAQGTPTITPAADTDSGISLDLIGDNDAAVLEYYDQIVAFTEDGIAAVSVHVKRGSSTSSVIRVRDFSGGGATKLEGVVTWSVNEPVVVTPTYGTFLDAVLLPTGTDVYRLRFAALAVVAANQNHVQIIPASDVTLAGTRTGTIYAGGVQVESRTEPAHYVKTTDATKSDTIKSPSGLVNLTATREGRTPAVQSVNIEPKGAIVEAKPTFSLEAEATSRDGYGDGKVRLLAQFDASTLEMWVYASESKVSGGAQPNMTSPVAVLRRMAGIIASDDNWPTELDTPTTPGWYRQVKVLVYGAGGGPGLRFPNVVDLEAQAVDSVSPGPSAPPSGFSVAFSTVGGIPRATLAWTIGDALAQPRVFRNDGFLIRLDAGDLGMVDDGLDPGTVYTYKMQTVRNGQTSEFADVGTGGGGGGGGGPSDTPTLDAPSFATGYPYGGPLQLGDGGYINVRVVNPDPLAYTLVWMNDDVTDSGTFSTVASVLPGSTDATISGTTGVSRWFYLTSVRSGYTTSSASAHANATFGSDG